MTLRTKILLGTAVIAAVTLAVIVIAGRKLSARFEPYIREQAIQYLTKRFDSEVEFGNLRVELPKIPPLRLFFTKGRGVIAQVTGENIVLRHRGRRDIPPMFSIERLSFEVDLGRVFEPKKRVAVARLERVKIYIPPKGERPSLREQTPSAPAGEPPPSSVLQDMPAAKDYLIEQVLISDSMLVILPRSKNRQPLEFHLHRVALDSVQLSEALRYEAELTNPKPPGLVTAKGNFGPWNADTPSDSALSGQYVFSDADLGVFRAIAGTLQSTGEFKGSLGEIEARGEARVSNFRLKMAGNPLPLETTYEALIDGTNGNTVLKPVRARLNTTSFTTSGAVIKHDGDARRTIELEVQMPGGNLLDLLKLAMKASPPMSGAIRMTAKIRVPPLQGKVAEKLIVDGRFAIDRGQFLRAGVQEKLDTLSRRAQGQPKNESIDDVFSNMAGVFHLADEEITFSDLTFRVPGAAVVLTGSYDLDADEIDFKGSLKLQAKVSQTMSGWKRWVLKPVDPILARNGAGTFLKISVTGSSTEPRFGAGW